VACSRLLNADVMIMIVRKLDEIEDGPRDAHGAG
jgi:hypothetical protein